MGLNELKALASCLVENNDVKNLKKRSGNMVKAGEEFYLYFKVANIAYKQASGASCDLKLAVKKMGKVLIEVPMGYGNILAASPQHQDQVLESFQNAVRFKFSPETAPGVYNVVLTFKDVNADKTVDITYPVTVSKP